jgi:hypothetical protein
LAPREVHSRGWLANYIPKKWDRLFGHRQRGIFPWKVTGRVIGYVDLVRQDREKYFDVRSRIGDSFAKITALRMIAAAGSLFGLSCGAVTPSFFLALRKPTSSPNDSSDTVI